MRETLYRKVKKKVWYAYSFQSPGAIAAADSFFITEESGVKEYALAEAEGRHASTNREVLTELANALLAKGDLAEAECVVAKVAREIDADYPPVRALRARIEKAKGDS